MNNENFTGSGGAGSPGTVTLVCSESHRETDGADFNASWG